MTNEEAKAIFLLEYCSQNCGTHYRRHCDNCEINVAIKALEKQIPKPIVAKKLNEPVTIGRATFCKGTNILAICPSCGGWVNKHHRYCQECGQAVYQEVEE